jgi:hypothetical protein
MALLAVVILVVALTLFFTLTIRKQDLPRAEPISPTQHLEDRKAQIYENLRDLQFEYRVGKLSDEDYQQTKLVLQKELAVVLGEIAKFENPAQPAPVSPAKPPANVCPHCKATFPKPMKFCGECGKAMAV